MTLKSNIILKVLNVFTWAGFIGLCVKAGALITSFGISMFINPSGSKNLYLGLDLSQLKEYSNYQYAYLVSSIISIFILQAIMFYVLLSIFKKINLVNPFDQLIGKLFSKLSLVSFAIGVLSKVTFELSSKYISQGMNFPNLIEHIIHGDAFLFFAGILLFVSMLYKRGIELQTENDLTI